MKAYYPMKFDTPYRGLEYLEYYPDHKAYHPGWDLNKGIGDQDLGDPVVCPVNGKVEYVSPTPTKWNRKNGGFGLFVIVYHEAYGYWSRFAHLNKVDVILGQTLKAGERLGDVGKSGTTYAHLHWEVFNSKMFDIQKKHWRKFAYYPSRKHKQFIVDHYIDGLQWIDDINAKPNWKSTAQERIVGLKLSNGERPEDNASRVELWQTILSLYDKFK